MVSSTNKHNGENYELAIFGKLPDSTTYRQDDNIELTNDDRIRKEEYIAQKENLLKEINQMIGGMTNSGVREKIKKIPKSDLKDKVKKFLDKRIGHSKKDYSSMNVEQVTKEYNDIKLMYENEYRKILKEIDYLEKSK